MEVKTKVFDSISTGKYWDKPWSLISGCTPCSPGCDHCWSASLTHRFTREGEPGHSSGILTDEKGHFNGTSVLHPERLTIPMKRKMPTAWAIWGDLFHEEVPFEFILAALAHAVTAHERHKYLILTKRPARMLEFFRWMDNDAPYRVEMSRDCWWLGCTVCNQQEADEKIPLLLQIPAAVRWVSIEPMLGEIDLKYPTFNGADSLDSLEGIHLVALGGETGPGARRLNLEWVRSIRDQCQASGVPFFFKAWGPRKEVGRILDGRTWDELPNVKG